MIKSVNGKTTYTNYTFSKATAERFIDIHCHCLPGLDDGPAEEAEALELYRQMADDGITAAIATPHQLGRFEGSNQAAKVREAVINCNNILKQNDIPLTIFPGGEVRVDERTCHLLETDVILTLADKGKYILLELPNDIFIDIDSLIRELSSTGIQSVIAHAERIPHLSHRPEILSSWLEHGGSLQITASSLTGDSGLEYQRNSWQLLCSGCVSFIATDSHDTNSRRPQMRAAFQFVSKNLGIDTAYLLCKENPLRIINSQDIDNRGSRIVNSESNKKTRIHSYKSLITNHETQITKRQEEDR